MENIGNQYTSQENKKSNVKNEDACCSKKNYRFGGILLAIILILLVLLVIQRHSNDQDAVERKHKEAQFQKQQDEEIALKEKLNNLNDKDYIEKVARDDYYLSNKGEVIFRLPGDNKSSKSKSSDDDDN